MYHFVSYYLGLLAQIVTSSHFEVEILSWEGEIDMIVASCTELIRRLQVETLLKSFNKTPTEMLSRGFCEIFQNSLSKFFVTPPENPFNTQNQITEELLGSSEQLHMPWNIFSKSSHLTDTCHLFSLRMNNWEKVFTSAWFILASFVPNLRYDSQRIFSALQRSILLDGKIYFHFP